MSTSLITVPVPLTPHAMFKFPLLQLINESGVLLLGSLDLICKLGTLTLLLIEWLLKIIPSVLVCGIFIFSSKKDPNSLVKVTKVSLLPFIVKEPKRVLLLEVVL